MIAAFVKGLIAIFDMAKRCQKQIDTIHTGILKKEKEILEKTHIPPLGRQIQKDIQGTHYYLGSLEQVQCEPGDMTLGSVHSAPPEKSPHVSSEQSNVDQDVLKHLVSETVKKVLSHAEILPGSIVSASVNTLVSKVVEELKPSTSIAAESPPSVSQNRLYLPPAGTPSYKPTPIAQLKRHVPVPYIPVTPCRLKPKPISNIRVRDSEISVPNSLTGVSREMGFSNFNKEYVYKPSSFSSLCTNTGSSNSLPVKSSSPVPQTESAEEDDAKSPEIETEDVPSRASVQLDGVDVTNELDLLNNILTESDEEVSLAEEENKDINCSDGVSESKASEEEKDRKNERSKSSKSHSREKSRSHSHSQSSSHSSSKNKENEKQRSRSKHSSHRKENHKRSHSDSSRSDHKRTSSSNKSSHSRSSSSSHKHSHKHRKHSPHDVKTKNSHSRDKSHSKKSSRNSKYSDSRSKRNKKENSHTDTCEEAASSEDEVGNETYMDASSVLPSPPAISESDEETVMQECRRIFEEYKPEPKQDACAPKKMTWSEEFGEDEEAKKKKRIAHDGAKSLHPVLLLPKPKAINPIQTMTQRLMKIQEVQQQHKATRIKQAPVFSQVMMERIARLKELKKGSSDDSKVIQPTSSLLLSKAVQPASTSSAPGAVKIASVQNVQLLLNAKNRMQAQLEMRSKTRSASSATSTIAHTVAKGAQRVAHVPSQKIIVRPIIANESGGKFPANFRQKHLDHLVQEYMKLSGDVQYASTKAKDTENEICERATSRMVYASIMATTIKKIRRECEIKAGEYSGAAKDKSVVTGSNSKGSWSMRKATKETESGFSISRIYQQLLPYTLSQEDLVANGYPRPHPEERGMAVITVNSAFRNKSCNPGSMLRTCCRCGKSYTVNKYGLQIKDEQCIYHWGHLIQTRAHGGWERRYTCCSGDSEGIGCGVAACHVSDGFNPEELRGYVKTLPVDKDPEDGIHGVYALDCEMCYTTSGLELTRITMVDSSLNTVYETLVKPSNPIIDYNTRFSGITEEDMKGVTTSIFDVQATLLSIVHEKTILIGHSLESDFKALKIIHDTVVDTSVVFPHRMGPPKKRALKNLCRDYLKKIIQESVNGHDSAEDAKACMELMIWKLQNQAT